MDIKAKLKHLRIAPRKVRLVANAVRGENVLKARTFLNFTVKRATGPILKLLNSAIANAKNNHSIDESNLYISEIMVDQGQTLKRWMPRARGSATQIQKKTSHITLTLNEIKKSAKTKKKKEGKPDVISEAVGIEKIEKPKWGREKISQKIGLENKASKKMFRRKSI